LVRKSRWWRHYYKGSATARWRQPVYQLVCFVAYGCLPTFGLINAYQLSCFEAKFICSTDERSEVSLGQIRVAVCDAESSHSQADDNRLSVVFVQVDDLPVFR
jgi:hypothetical protein